VDQLKAGRGRTFYAVEEPGAHWRASTSSRRLPLRVMHGYSIPAQDALDFAQRLRRLASANMLANIRNPRRCARGHLLTMRRWFSNTSSASQPKTIVFSTYGVREGLLYEMLPEAERSKDGFYLRRAGVERNSCRGRPGMPRN